ncbi:MAG: N-glycosylase/DNA lyase [Candidatus Muiribacteriota bacterium]
MKYNEKELKEILSIYKKIKPDIIKRLNEFKQKWKKGSDEDIFYELMFCLFTPQSKALKCWEAVCSIKEKYALNSLTADKINPLINSVRFKNKKALYCDEALNKFIIQNKVKIKSFIKNLGSPVQKREWLVKNIKGYGYKEASHFLRNIGKGEKLAILDRHILKNIKALNIIDSLPANLSKTNYLRIEKKLELFAKKTGIPLSHLDLLLWYREAGEIFK